MVPTEEELIACLGELTAKPQFAILEGHARLVMVTHRRTSPVQELLATKPPTRVLNLETNVELDIELPLPLGVWVQVEWE